jgi:hypothetical protein
MTRRFAIPLLLCLAIAAVAVMAVRHTVIALPFPYPIEYPEGITTHWSQQATSGASLYPAVDPVTPLHNPYPPLFYRLVVPFQARLANPFLPSRLMALSGLILCGIMIARLLQRHGAGYALGGSLLFMLSTTALHYGTTARVDLPALALALASIGVLTTAPPRGRAFVLAGLLAGGALLTKPTYVAVVATGLLTTSLRGWRPLTSWMTGFGVALIASIPLFNAAPANLINHLWTLNQLPWDPVSLGRLIGQTLARHPILATGLVLFLFRTAKKRDAFWWYAILALPTILFAGKTGADENYFLEIIAIAVVASVRLAQELAEEATPQHHDTAPGSVLLLLAAMQILLFLPIEPTPVFTRTYEQELAATATRLTPSPDEAQAAALVVSEIRAAGSVLSHSPGLLIAAGRPAGWDAYQFTRRANAGRWDDAPLAARVADGTFDLVLMRSDAATNYFPARVRAAVEARYTLHRDLGPWRLMKPTGP